MRMRVGILVLLTVVACKDRGTIDVPLIAPCDPAVAAELTGVAVYLRRGGCDAETITCGLSTFSCTTPDCIAACAGDQSGYCSPDEVASGLAIDPPVGGVDYALIMSYRYAGGTRDEGLACFDLHVDADGTTSMTVSGDEAGQCCLAP